MEVWKDIEGYDGLYQISNLGYVKSFKCSKEVILKNNLNNNGYLKVGLCKNGKSKTKNIHQIVAVAFLSHKQNGYKTVVDHKNGIKTDNRVENLQLITQRENVSKDQKSGDSKYTGVCWHKQANKWRANIQIKGKTKYLGLFKNEIDASNAYKTELKKIKNS